jgi:hypothetical protein
MKEPAVVGELASSEELTLSSGKVGHSLRNQTGIVLCVGLAEAGFPRFELPLSRLEVSRKVSLQLRRSRLEAREAEG